MRSLHIIAGILRYRVDIKAGLDHFHLISRYAFTQGGIKINLKGNFEDPLAYRCLSSSSDNVKIQEEVEGQNCILKLSNNGKAKRRPQERDVGQTSGHASGISAIYSKIRSDSSHWSDVNRRRSNPGDEIGHADSGRQVHGRLLSLEFEGGDSNDAPPSLMNTKHIVKAQYEKYGKDQNGSARQTKGYNELEEEASGVTGAPHRSKEWQKHKHTEMGGAAAAAAAGKLGKGGKATSVIFDTKSEVKNRPSEKKTQTTKHSGGTHLHREAQHTEARRPSIKGTPGSTPGHNSLATHHDVSATGTERSAFSVTLPSPLSSQSPTPGTSSQGTSTLGGSSLLNSSESQEVSRRSQSLSRPKRRQRSSEASDVHEQRQRSSEASDVHELRQRSSEASDVHEQRQRSSEASDVHELRQRSSEASDVHEVPSGNSSMGQSSPKPPWDALFYAARNAHSVNEVLLLLSQHKARGSLVSARAAAELLSTLARMEVSHTGGSGNAGLANDQDLVHSLLSPLDVGLHTLPPQSLVPLLWSIPKLRLRPGLDLIESLLREILTNEMEAVRCRGDAGLLMTVHGLVGLRNQGLIPSTVLKSEVPATMRSGAQTLREPHRVELESSSETRGSQELEGLSSHQPTDTLRGTLRGPHDTPPREPVSIHDTLTHQQIVLRQLPDTLTHQQIVLRRLSDTLTHHIAETCRPRLAQARDHIFSGLAANLARLDYRNKQFFEYIAEQALSRINTMPVLSLSLVLRSLATTRVYSHDLMTAAEPLLIEGLGSMETKGRGLLEVLIPYAHFKHHCPLLLTMVIRKAALAAQEGSISPGATKKLAELAGSLHLLMTTEEDPEGSEAVRSFIARHAMAGAQQRLMVDQHN